jgi:hypothetical protein
MLSGDGGEVNYRFGIDICKFLCPSKLVAFVFVLFWLVMKGCHLQIGEIDRQAGPSLPQTGFLLHPPGFGCHP